MGIVVFRTIHSTKMTKKKQYHQYRPSLCFSYFLPFMFDSVTKNSAIVVAADVPNPDPSNPTCFCVMFICAQPTLRTGIENM